VSVTSRILVVDLLTGSLPATLISGLVVLHAERSDEVSPTSYSNSSDVLESRRRAQRRLSLDFIGRQTASVKLIIAPCLRVSKCIKLLDRLHKSFQRPT
jgi:hypothetical protein